MKLVLASNNEKKLKEMRALLAPMGFELITQGELGIEEADEPFSTFFENALAKARHVAKHSRLPAISDDSGICVDALGGAPGVNSAYHAGLPRSDARNNEKLIADLRGVANRKAHYTSVIVLLRSVTDPEPLVAHGQWHGEVIDAPRGSGGFGYDPHFWVAEHHCTAAELSMDIKNQLSHRSKALRSLREQLERGGLNGV